MDKKAYNSAPIGEGPATVGPSADLVDKESATETGGRGINLVEMTSTFDGSDIAEKTEPEFESKNEVIPQKILDLLVLLGDEMDKSEQESLANFTDFLLTKFAETKKINYTELFNNLMIKINNADIVHTNEIIKKLAKIYSRTLVLEYIKNKDLEKSKESAYKKTLHRADQYLSEE